MLTSGDVDENDLKNGYDTHFVFNIDNGNTLGLRGVPDVKCADVISGGAGITMFVRLSGGGNACIQQAFLFFKHGDRKYLFRDVREIFLLWLIMLIP